MTLRLQVAALSDVGRVRKDNQDSGYAGAFLLAVADGVGGAARGDIASSAAIDTLRKLDEPPGNDALSTLAGTLHLTHDRLAEIAEIQTDLDGTSTTVTAAIFDGTHARFAHIGDSRGYLLRDGVLRQLTADHTLVQSLVDEGRITAEEARTHPHRNLILKAVDGVHDPDPDLFSVELQNGDRLLLCSDGCSGVLDDEELGDLLGLGTLEVAAAGLVRAALDGGSTDNVTVVVADVLDADLRSQPPLVVGAAARRPHLDLTPTGLAASDPLATAASSIDRALGRAEAARTDAEASSIDPEELRYAPRAPRRFGWIGRLVVLLLVVGAAGYGGVWLRDWSQDQFYVAVDRGELVIYRGLEIDLPLVGLNSVYRRTGLDIEALPESLQAQVRAGGPAANTLGSAEEYVSNVRAQCAAAVAASRGKEAERPPLRVYPPWYPNPVLIAIETEECGAG